MTWTNVRQGLPVDGEVVKTIFRSGIESELQFINENWCSLDGVIQRSPVFWKRMGT